MSSGAIALIAGILIGKIVKEPEPPPPPPVSISKSKTIQFTTERNIGGVSIVNSASWPRTPLVTTDESGNATLELSGTATTRFVLQGAKDGYNVTLSDSIFTLDAAPDVITIYAIPQEQIEPIKGVTIAFNVRVTLNGQPAEGAVVSVTGKNISGKTNQSGRYDFSIPDLHINEKVYISAKFTHNGEELSASKTETIQANKNSHDVTLALRQEYAISINVFDENNNPITNPVVTRGGNRIPVKANVATDAVNQLNTAYTYSIGKSGYEGKELSVTPTERSTSRDVQLAKLLVNIFVQDSIQKVPLNDVDVSISELSYTGETNITGYVKDVNIAELNKTLAITVSKGNEFPRKTVRVTPSRNGQEIRIDLAPRPGSIELTFVWEHNGDAVEGGQVRNLQAPGKGISLPVSKTNAQGIVRYEHHHLAGNMKFTGELLTELGTTVQIQFSTTSRDYRQTFKVPFLVEVIVRASESGARVELLKAGQVIKQGTGEIRELVEMGMYTGRASFEGLTREKSESVNRPGQEIYLIVTDFYSRAEREERNGNVSQAIQYYRQVDIEDDRCAQARLNAIRLMRREGQNSNPILELSKTIIDSLPANEFKQSDAQFWLWRAEAAVSEAEATSSRDAKIRLYDVALTSARTADPMLNNYPRKDAEALRYFVFLYTAQALSGKFFAVYDPVLSPNAPNKGQLVDDVKRAIFAFEDLQKIAQIRNESTTSIENQLNSLRQAQLQLGN